MTSRGYRRKVSTPGICCPSAQIYLFKVQKELKYARYHFHGATVPRTKNQLVREDLSPHTKIGY